MYFYVDVFVFGCPKARKNEKLRFFNLLGVKLWNELNPNMKECTFSVTFKIYFRYQIFNGHEMCLKHDVKSEKVSNMC